jgi:hypothetical protein
VDQFVREEPSRDVDYSHTGDDHALDDLSSRPGPPADREGGQRAKTSAEDGIKIGDGGIAAPPSPSGARETCGGAGGQLERNPAFTYKFGRGAGVAQW